MISNNFNFYLLIFLAPSLLQAGNFRFQSPIPLNTQPASGGPLIKVEAQAFSPAPQIPHAYSGNDIEGVQDLANKIATGTEPWRTAANKRIAVHRQAELWVALTDKDGNPYANVPIRVRQTQHGFDWTVILRAENFSTDMPVEKGLPPLEKREILPYFANSTGFHNALKYRLKDRSGRFAQEALDWLSAINMPVRGHTLIWPSFKHTHDDAKQFENDHVKLEAFLENQIVEYARKWDVYEWDVINEPRANFDFMDIFGNDVMVKWFKLAKNNLKNPNARLYLNDYQVISAFRKVDEHLQHYYDTVKFLLQSGAPLEGLGMQSRFKEYIPPDTIYERLDRYKEFNLPIKGTEFEIRDTLKLFSEEERATMTEEIMTVYFSHPSVNGLCAWDFFQGRDDLSTKDVDPITNEMRPKRTGLIYHDGELKPNGKIWLFLINQFWNTDLTLTTDHRGMIKLRAFKGKYELSYQGRNGLMGGHFELIDDNTKIHIISPN